MLCSYIFFHSPVELREAVDDFARASNEVDELLEVSATLNNVVLFVSLADVNSPDSFGKTPLHNAILGKHVGIVEQLLKSGANVKCIDERGDSPLHAAAKVNSEAIVTVSI